MIRRIRISSFAKTFNNYALQLMLFFAVFTSSVIPVESATIKQIPVIAFLLCALGFRNFLKGKRIYLLTGLIIILFTSMLANGILVMKDLFLYFFSYIVIYYIVSRGGFDYRFLYLFIVLTLLWYLLKNPNTVTYIPQKMVINVYGEGTKHGTALLGTALMLPALYVCYLRWHLALRLRWSDIVCLIGGGYFIFFSSSRSAVLAVLATLLMLIVNWNGLKKWLTWTLFWVFNLSTYFLELLQGYTRYLNNIPILSDFIHVDNFDKAAGVTSGRAWLWKYHIDTFLNHPIFGGGREFTDFGVNDYIGRLGENAHAGSESPFTGMLACNGMIGLIQIGLVIYLFQRAVKAKNVLGTTIMFCCIYNTTMGMNYLINRGVCILIIALYFMSFYDNRLLVYPRALLKRLKDYKEKQSLRVT